MRAYVLICFLLLSWPAFATPATAAEPEVPEVPEVLTVVVPGRKVVSWPYRTLAQGLAAFDRHRGMAPAATLRFRLRPRKEDADLTGLSLFLVGGHWHAPLVTHERGRFTLPASEAAASDDAYVTINRKREQFDPATIPLAEVRTPGLPDNAVRMGDLRLECEVNQAIARKHLGFMMTMALNALAGFNWCDRRDGGGHAAHAARPFTRAVLVEGERRAVLYEGRERTSHSVKIQDASWSHEARVEFSAP